MAPRSERRGQTPPEVRLQYAFANTLNVLGTQEDVWTKERLEALHLDRIAEARASHGLVMFFGTKTHDEHLQRSGEHTTQRPFGLSINTLSHNVKGILYPQTVFPPSTDDEQIAQEEDAVLRREGPQAMLYFLDDFEHEAGQIENLGANLVFTGRLIDASLNNGYPIERDEQSPEFVGQVKGAYADVRDFIRLLDETQQSQLSPAIRKIATMDDTQLSEAAVAYTRYQVEPLKAPGLRDPGELFMRPDAPAQTPQAAIADRKEYLHITDRNLPEIIPGKGAIPTPPWKEYGRNRWNRDHQLFGRYELAEAGLRVDYRLDSTHMPAKYGFFETIEIAQVNEAGIQQHVILGQEIDKEKEASFALLMFGDPKKAQQFMDEQQVVFPIVVAGDFNFSEESNRKYLEALARDKGTKPEVAKVLLDVLKFSDEGKLTRIQRLEE